MTFATTPVTRAAAPAPVVLGPARRAVGAACLLLGPLCFTAAEALTQEGTDDPNQILTQLAANPGATAGSIVLSLLSAAFFLWGLFAVAARRLTRGRVLVSSGLAMTLWAMLANTLLLGVNVAFLAISGPGLDRGAMISAIKAVERSPLAPIAITGHYLLVIAFVLLGIGFWRAGIGPRWAAVLIALCGVVDSAEGLLGSTGHMLLGIVISDGMLIAGFAAVGWHLLREATEASTPDRA